MKSFSALLRTLRTNQSIVARNSLPKRLRIVPSARTRGYVNWTPDKNKSPSSSSPLPNGDPQSPAELDKAFQAEPQLLRLKNNKTFNQWEREWTERVWRAGQFTLVLGIIMAAYAVGAGYIELPYGMNYRAGKLPAPGSEEEEKYIKQVEKTLHSLPIVQDLSKDSNWIKTIGIFPIPKEDAVHNLTMGVLAGPGRITAKPVTFYNNKTKEFVVVMHLGQDICGHRGLVHGGFLATVLDECLGKTCITTLSKEFDESGKRQQVWPEDRIIVTANLNINYRAPTRVNQFVVVKSILIESADRKAKAKGRIETVDETPVLLCEGEGLFVKPSKDALQKILGK